jgi:hypothetical protein
MEGHSKMDFRGIVCKDSDRVGKQIAGQNLLRKLGDVLEESMWTDVEACLRRYKRLLYAPSAKNACGLKSAKR